MLLPVPFVSAILKKNARTWSPALLYILCGELSEVLQLLNACFKSSFCRRCR